MQKFDLNGKKFFLTYPHCDLARDVVLDMLRTKLAGWTVVEYAIAIEQHEDGTPHIHAYLDLDRRKHITNSAFFDLGDRHGNYQQAKSKKAVFEYVSKSDGELLTNITAESLKTKKEPGVRALIGKRMLDGEKAIDLLEEYPQLYFGFNRLQQDEKAVADAKTVYPDLPQFLPNGWNILIDTGALQKQRHWWIFSTVPNRGKTTFARDMENRFKAYIKSGDFTYWNVTGRETLIILDDYNTAALKFSSLNQLCDGTFEARVFMGGVKRLQPRLVIVLSNVAPRDLYPHMYALLEARFIVHELV